MAGAAAFSSVRRPGGTLLPALPPLILVAPLLAASALLPPAASVLTALAAVIVLGVPHGALDGEIARDVLRPRFGRMWFPVFAGPYLALAALVLVAWRLAPLPTLGGFLAVSVWHFGAEDSRSGTLLEQLARGGLPIGLPVLVQPAATAWVLGTVAGAPMPDLPAWLTAGALVWLALALLWSIRSAVEGRWQTLLGQAMLGCAFVVLPPVTAFALYFVLVHAPAHTRALIADAGRARRVHDARSAVLRALPLSVMTIAMGAALWSFYEGPAAARLLALTLQGLAALTLPHLLLDIGTARLSSAAR